MGPRKLAKEIKHEADLSADISQIETQVETMREMGASDEQIRENLPKVIRAKTAHEEVLDQSNEDTDSSNQHTETDDDSNDEKWIEVENLPSEYKRDDWS